MSPRRLGAVIAVAALVLDQLSKNFLLYGLGLRNFGPGERIDVAPFFDIVMVWNRGVSYGLFQADGVLGTVVLASFSVVAVALLAWWLAKADRLLLATGLGLIIGGAVGNVIDRVIYGAVADFFHFYAFGFDWYVFNVADAAISIGVVLLLADSFAGSRQSGQNSRKN